MQDNIVNTREQYYTWDIFRKDLELNFGHLIVILRVPRFSLI
ncbi:MAG: hypothetical protein H6Q39_1503 [Chloroflexi bacterium]|nr:hypothetical protein [Chloroflexota bacterium]